MVGGVLMREGALCVRQALGLHARASMQATQVRCITAGEGGAAGPPGVDVCVCVDCLWRERV